MRFLERRGPGRAIGELEIDHIALVIDEAAEHHQPARFVDHQWLAPDPHIETIRAEFERARATVWRGFHAVFDSMTERRELRMQRAVIVGKRREITVRDANEFGTRS